MQPVYPKATQKPVSYAGEAGKFTTAPIGWILHVTCMHGSPYNVFQNAKSPKRRFSHLWVAKDGTIEQYAPLDQKSWAQASGNGTYISIETDGLPEEPLTPQQIQALAEFHKWSGLPNTLAEKPGEPGIGTHYMGGKDWGGHTCPDPAPGKGPRSKQRHDILLAAQSAVKPAPPVTKPVTEATTMDEKTIATTVWGPNSPYIVLFEDNPIEATDRKLPDGRTGYSPIVALKYLLDAVDGLTRRVDAIATMLQHSDATGQPLNSAGVSNSTVTSTLTDADVDRVATRIVELLYTRLNRLS